MTNNNFHSLLNRDIDWGLIVNTQEEFQSHRKVFGFDGVTIYDGQRYTNGYIGSRKVIITESAREGAVGVMRSVSELMHNFKPLILTNTGTGGLRPHPDDDVSSGDVIVPTKIACYDFVNMVDGSLIDLGCSYQPHPTLMALAKQVQETQWYKGKIPFSSSDHINPDVKFRTLITGEKKLSDANSYLQNEILSRNKDARIVDMESWYFMDAIHLSGSLIPVIVTRVACDDIVRSSNIQDQRNALRSPCSGAIAEFNLELIKTAEEYDIFNQLKNGYDPPLFQHYKRLDKRDVLKHALEFGSSMAAGMASKFFLPH